MPHFIFHSRQFCAKNLLAGAVAAALGVGAIAARADPAAATEAADTPTSEGSLQEIVVTAQKRTEKEVDVPISVAVLSGTAAYSAKHHRRRRPSAGRASATCHLLGHVRAADDSRRRQPGSPAGIGAEHRHLRRWVLRAGSGR